jgi:NodT family efflux transporter outer membrane factor (OMF) lipoprotein
MSRCRVWCAAAAVSLFAACAAGPEYRKPAVEMPAAWKVEAPWRVGTPRDDVPKGQWWQVFVDAQLDALIQQALTGSPTLALANARLTQARAQLSVANAALYPQLNLNLREQRQAISANRSLTNPRQPQLSTSQNDFITSLNASYEADFSGRVQRVIESAAATAEQSAADFENVRLLLTADVATAYFNARAIDIELDVLLRSIELQRRVLGLATSRHELGVASGLDVAQQQALLDSTLAQVDVLRRTRAQFEHALATLTGVPAPVFSLAPDVRRPAPPAVPIGVPSDVLERRPDVASAERAMAAANAQIGIANAAFYPSVSIGAAYGSETNILHRMFDVPSIIWSVGASIAQPIFDGGRIRANLESARAGYDATVANYRRVVLTAMQEVEDGIIGMAALERAHVQALAATKSASRVLDLATTRYEGGVATYLDVVTAQQGLLNSERLAAQLQGQRLLTAVFLVKALGGDWSDRKNLASGMEPGYAKPGSVSY